MVESCAKKSIRLYVNYIRRSDPAMVEVKNRIEAQKFAGPIKGQVWYTNGFMNNGSHFFNLLEYWLGSMTAFKDITLNNSLENDDFDIDVTVSFMKGSVSFSSLWEPAYSYHSVELFAQNGRMLYRQGIPYVSWQQSQADPRFKSYMALVRKPERIMLDMDKYQFNVVDQISADLKRVKSSVCCSTDALHTLRSMQKIVSKVA
jgi:predicted dehydrogenase